MIKIKITLQWYLDVVKRTMFINMASHLNRFFQEQFKSLASKKSKILLENILGCNIEMLT